MVERSGKQGEALPDWAADRMVEAIIGRATARVDIPVINRRSLRDEAELLHQLANALTRLSLDGPGETLADRSALVLAQNAIYGCQAALRRIKLEDEARIKEARVAEKLRAVPKFGVERKAG